MRGNKNWQMDEDADILRVKDIFYFYYARQHGGEDKAIEWKSNAKQGERDVVIDYIIRTIR